MRAARALRDPGLIHLFGPGEGAAEEVEELGVVGLEEGPELVCDVVGEALLVVGAVDGPADALVEAGEGGLDGLALGRFGDGVVRRDEVRRVVEGREAGGGLDGADEGEGVRAEGVAVDEDELVGFDALGEAAVDLRRVEGPVDVVVGDAAVRAGLAGLLELERGVAVGGDLVLGAEELLGAGLEGLGLPDELGLVDLALDGLDGVAAPRLELEVREVVAPVRREARGDELGELAARGGGDEVRFAVVLREAPPALGTLGTLGRRPREAARRCSPRRMLNAPPL